MKTNAFILVTALGVLASLALMLSGLGGLWTAALAGFVFVVGGSFLAAISSQSAARVLGVLFKTFSLLKDRQQLGQRKALLEHFLHIADWLRRGNSREAERQTAALEDDFWRRGVMLVLDRTPERELLRTLQWRIGHEREQDMLEIQVMRSLASYAPALGMMGTLLGLVQMLFGLGEKGVNEVGMAMGFAMLTTVYGLIGANLLLKPVILTLEQRSRSRLAWMYAQLEAVLMLKERSHPYYIRDALETCLEAGRSYELPSLAKLSAGLHRAKPLAKAAVSKAA
jgi:chemotaxis protein MotA